jgi:hypothetical protein
VPTVGTVTPAETAPTVTTETVTTTTTPVAVEQSSASEVSAK